MKLPIITSYKATSAPVAPRFERTGAKATIMLPLTGIPGSSGVQRSCDARGDFLIVCHPPTSSIEQWRMVVIVTGYKLFVKSSTTPYSHLQIKVLAKFVDTACIQFYTHSLFVVQQCDTAMNIN